MLRVSYTNPMGYVIVTRTTDQGKRKAKFWCCWCNTDLWAEIQHTRNADGERVHLLQLFFYDNEHLRNILKYQGADACQFLADRHYHFNSYYSKPRTTTIRLLNKLGAKVSFYYEDPTEKTNKSKSK